jgi:hydroxymethylpyrimidine pyrophosphatase-like HAD family hydrolase
MAIGDYDNDIEMIAYAGLGVAMGNAVPEVKKAADVITLDNQNDGVAHAIEKYCLL